MSKILVVLVKNLEIFLKTFEIVTKILEILTKTIKILIKKIWILRGLTVEPSSLHRLVEFLVFNSAKVLT